MLILFKASFFTFVLYTFTILPFFSQAQDSLFQKGEQLLKANETEQALNLWLTQHDEKAPDFRIGYRFLETVVKHNKTELYPAAYKMYMDGLNDSSPENYFNFIERDARKIIPLLESNTSEQWQTYIESSDTALLTELKSYWIQNNPSITSAYNERLIEHWERITYARNHFNENSSSPYDTDDRGLIYVKYGEPDSTASGQFLLNSHQVHFFAREIIRQQEEERSTQASQPPRSGSGEEGLISSIVEDQYLDNLSKAAVDRVLSTRISSRYEVWIYDRARVSLPENLIFLFGQHADTGRYGSRSSVEEFIPRRSFRNRDIRIGNFRFNIGSILQLSLYHDIKFIDDKFNDIYYDLFDQLMSDQSIISEGASDYLSVKYQNELDAMRNSAPVNLTPYDHFLHHIDLQYESYNFLDQELRPQKILIVYSNPHSNIIRDYSQYSESAQIEPSYHLRNRVSMYDQDWNLIRSQNDFPVISFEEDEITEMMYPSVSIFSVSKADIYSDIILSSTLFNENALPAFSNTNRPHLPDQLIGESSITLFDAENREQDRLNTENFEVSDLIIGYRGDFEFDENLLIPFYVPSEKIFSVEADLHFLFEVYNIPLTDENNYNYNVDVYISPNKRQNIFRRIFRSSDSEEHVSLEIESNQNRSRQSLQLNISDYDAGDYTLNVFIYSDSHDEQIRRSKDFTIK
jgi:GWxTD domain-containing protein